MYFHFNPHALPYPKQHKLISVGFIYNESTCEYIVHHKACILPLKALNSKFGSSLIRNFRHLISDTLL